MKGTASGIFSELRFDRPMVYKYRPAPSRCSRAGRARLARLTLVGVGTGSRAERRQRVEARRIRSDFFVAAISAPSTNRIVKDSFSVRSLDRFAA
jgi:hypothetical protein